PFGERLPAPGAVLGVRVRGVQGLQVDDVVRYRHPVIAEFVGDLGDLDDLLGVQKRAADVELHSADRAHDGVMRMPSASTVRPSASERWPETKDLTPSVRSMAASTRNAPSGVPRTKRSVKVPVNSGLVRPELAASPSTWSSTSAQTPPCTQPGGPS